MSTIFLNITNEHLSCTSVTCAARGSKARRAAFDGFLWKPRFHLALQKRNADELTCAARGNRTPDASLFQRLVDYIIIPALTGSWALVRGYRWDSLASLYTFIITQTQWCLARDCLIKMGYPPNSPNFSHSPLLEKAPKISGLRSTTELPRQNQILWTLEI